MGRFINNENSVFQKWAKKLVNDGGDIQTAKYYGDNVCVYKVGKVCFITCVTGSYYCTAGGALKQGSATGAEWIIPSGFRPVTNCEIREAFNGKRITVYKTGEVVCFEALSGANLRFSGCYIAAN